MSVAETKPAGASPLDKYLAVSGARVTKPVAAAKTQFSADFIKDARKNFGNFHMQMGGDHALYYAGRLSEFMPAGISSPNAQFLPLEENIQEGIGQIRQATGQGELTLDEYVAHPLFRVQGLMLIHKGRVVYQKFPGMKPTDRHFWASSAKVTVGLIVATLAEEGKIDVRQSVTGYVPQLAGTAWDDVRVIDLLNHTPAIDNEETLAALLDPGSIIVRFFSASFGSPNPATGKVEKWIEVVREMKRLPNEKPGERFRYSSVNTMALVQLIENIENAPWADIFERRVWSRMGARQPALTTLMPDGSAFAYGLISTTLEDFARLGMLFNPSWNKAAFEPVVSPAVLARIRADDNTKSYRGSAKELAAPTIFNEQAKCQSYQFDFVFEDGAMFKGGNLGQGLYVDPERDFVGAAFSLNPYVPPHGEFKAPAYMRTAAKAMAGK